MRSILVFFAGAAVLVGAYHCLAGTWAVRSLGETGSRVLPIAESLAIVRMFGPAIAAWCALLLGVRSTHGTKSLERGLAATALGIATFPIASVLALAGSVLVYRVILKQPVRVYLETAQRVATPADFVWALKVCLLNAAILAAGLFLARRFWTSDRYSLRRKVATAAVGFMLINFAARILSTSSFVDGS